MIINETGWEEGMVGMCPGEKRKLLIPSDMGYGARGAGRNIPRLKRFLLL
jgi:FKBP-type peptidyl-prolyl cis-trans isomerase